VVLEHWKDIPEIMQSLIKHLHGFVRDTEPTQLEMGLGDRLAYPHWPDVLAEAAGIIMASDVLGVSMLVDAINHRQAGKATPSTVEGPFHVPNAPRLRTAANGRRLPGHSLLCHRHGARPQ
jgi:hypothetical protein